MRNLIGAYSTWELPSISLGPSWRRYNGTNLEIYSADQNNHNYASPQFDEHT